MKQTKIRLYVHGIQAEAYGCEDDDICIVEDLKIFGSWISFKMIADGIGVGKNGKYCFLPASRIKELTIVDGDFEIKERG